MSARHAPGPGTAAWSVVSPDAATTAAIGKALGEAAPNGAVLLLYGALGAGKTTFAQGVARGCGVAERVASPTYNLVLHHSGARPFVHVDLYRLDDPGELATLDLDEILEPAGVTCVEWPEALAREVRTPWGEVRLTRESSAARRIAGTLTGPGWEPALAALAEAGARLA